MQSKHLIILFLLASVNGFSQDSLLKADSLTDIAGEFKSRYRYDSALKYYKKALNIDSLNHPAMKGAAISSYQLGLLTSAKNYYNKMLQTNSKNISALTHLGNIAMQRGNYKKARERFKRLASMDSTNTFYHKKLGSIYKKLGKDSLALNEYHTILEIRNNDLQAIIKLAKLQYGQKDYENSLKAIQSGLVQDSSHIKLQKLRIQTHYKLKNYQEVIHYGNKMDSVGEPSENIVKMTGVAYFRLKIYDEAIDWLTQLSKKDISPTLHHYLAISYRETQQWEKSLASFEKAITSAISGNYHRFFIHKGFTLEDLKDFPTAIKTYRKGYQITQKPILLFHLARAYDRFYKDKTPALRHYKLYINSGKTNRIYRTYSEKRIDALREHIHFNSL